MPTRADSLLRCVRRIASQAGPEADDSGLLTGFVTGRDPAAFEAIVARHGPMVLRVCRRLLGNRHDAEDAFQATFLVLARKAANVRPPGALAAWLHGVAYRVALGARAAARRRLREEPTPDLTPPDPQADPLAELTAREALQVLEEEVQRLPRAYRLPVVLCCLHGVSQEEAARQLGWTPGSVRGRLERGRKRLHQRLAARGLGLSAALGLVELSRGTSAGLEGLLATATAKAAVAFVAQDPAGAGLVSGGVVALARAALQHAAPARVSFGILLLALGVVAAGLAVPALSGPTGETPDQRLAAEPGPSARATAPTRTDRNGDPLPAGAVMRLGTVRYRVPGETQALAFAPDGKTLAISTGDLFLMDSATGKRVDHRFVDFFWRLDKPIAVSPDGKRLAGWGRFKGAQPTNGVMRVWELAGGSKPKDYDAKRAVWVGWSANNEPLMVSLEAGALRLDELASGQSRRFECENLRKPELSDHVRCTCAPAGKSLAVVDEQGMVHVWDTATGRERCTVRPKGASTYSLAFSPDGRALATLTRDAAQLWDATTGQALNTLATDQKYLTTVALAPDGKTLATAGDREIRFWDVATGREKSRTQERYDLGPSIAFSPDGKTLATAERHGTAIHLWDVATGKRKPQPVGHLSRPHGMVFWPGGRRGATGGGLDGTIQFWDLATGAPFAQVRRPGQWVRDIALSPNGSSLFSTWTDENLWVCDATTGERQHVIKLEDPDRPDSVQSAISMYPSSDGKTLVAFSYYYPKKNGAGPNYSETLITGWDPATRKQLFRRTRPGQDSWIALSPDARVLAAPHPQGARIEEAPPGKGPMRLEDVATGELLLTFPALEGQTWPLAFSPDGRLLASNNSDYKRKGKEGDPAGATGNTLHLWETATAADLLTLPTAGTYRAAAFSPDGRLLALFAPSQEILVWDLARGRERRRFKGFDGEVTYLTFTPDGRRLVSGLTDSTLLIWDVGPHEAAPAGKLGADGLTKAWADLAGADAPRAFRARWALALAPEEALPLLKERLRPARAVDAQQLRRRLADLDSEQFEVREKAQAALEELGDLAEPALREAVAGKPTPEVRRRVQAVLDQLRGPVTRPATLQSLRALAVLESVGTPEARELLKRLATGAPEAWLTREAKSSLERLSRWHSRKR